VIVHNSGHLAYFNTAAAEICKITRDTVAPPGSHYGKDPVTGELDGTAVEAPAVFAVVQPVMSQFDQAAAMLDECARLNRAGLTTCSEMAFDPKFRPLLDGLHDQLTVRLRPYEMSTAELHTDAAPDNGDDVVHQPGIKLWLDGSPWIGNIDLTFPYLDTDATQSMGVAGTTGGANYTKEQLLAIVRAYFPNGWQMACHVHGDHGVDTILDVYEQVLREHPRDDHRLRLEHVGAITAEQLQRAQDLGVTCSMFIDHLHYWGDVLVDDLFGEDHGSHWVRAASAVKTGMRISLHNDPPVTPEEPLRNMSVAITRKSPSGTVLAPEEALTIDQAIRAQTIDAAWQLFADNIIGSLEVGKYADMVALSADPHSVDPENIADITVLATFLAGREVYAAPPPARLTKVSRADVPDRRNERVLQ
jgi:predicted amidohydrolase YtcJ